MFNRLKSFFKKVSAFSVSTAILLSCCHINSVSAFAESAETVVETDDSSIPEIRPSSEENKTTYAEYKEKYSSANRTILSVYADTGSYSTSFGARCQLLSDYDGMPSTIHWQNGGTVTMPLEVPADGLYNLELIYRTDTETTTELSLGVLIDNELPFEEASKIVLDKKWKNKTGNIQYDSLHQNQIRPTQIVSDSWVTSTILNKSSFSAEPLSFYLTSGEHTVTLQNASSEVYIARVNFNNKSEAKSYSETKPSAEQIEQTPALSNGEAILIEAEVPSYTNSLALQPTREPTEYLASPAHPTQIRYNTIGSTTDSIANAWEKPSQKAVYEVTIPADGYYSLNLRCRRNSKEGVASYRKITVNGAVPCKELANIRISYSPHWQTINLTDENNEPIYVFLHVGTNTIEIEAVTGDMETYAVRAEQTVAKLNKLTASADIENSQSTVNSLKEISAEFNALNSEIRNTFGVELYEISNLELTLNSIVKTIEKNKASISEAVIGNKGEIGNRTAMLLNRLKNLHFQPLELDYFEIKTVHEEYRNTKVNFFKAIVFAFRSFIGSFFRDFDMLRHTEQRTMDVWVCLDRKEAEIVNNIVEKEYNVNHDIKINIRPDNGDLYTAVMSGKGPQAALYADADVICELQEHNVTVNIHDMQSFDEVYSRFPTGLSGIYLHDGEVHAVPLTNSFPMMFYRSDILEKMDLTVPQTWEEFIGILPAIYESGMKVGLISSADNEHGFSAGDVFFAMLSQTGETNLDSESAVEVFEKWSQIFCEYDVSDSNAFPLFRTGAMPIVIANYNAFSLQLSNEAYELSGHWSLAHIPGTYRTIDGLRTLDCSVNTNSLGAVIFSECENVSAAENFISWFTSDEIQRKVLDSFGVGKYSSANTAVTYPQMWTEKEYREISTQRGSTLEIHEISSSVQTKNAVYAALERTINGENAQEVFLDELRHHGIIQSN